MKRLFSMKFLLLVLTLVLVGCSNSSKTTEQYIPVRTYIMQESEEIIKPNVLLEDNNRFTFNYSVLSSYIPLGSYEEDDGDLILTTDGGEFKYVFNIKDNTLIFNAKESSELPSFANVPEGTIFK